MRAGGEAEQRRPRAAGIAAPGLSDISTTPAVAIRIASAIGQRHLVAEEDQAEQRDLHRLGLDVGDGHDERALAHGGEHQRGGGDLRHRADR